MPIAKHFLQDGGRGGGLGRQGGGDECHEEEKTAAAASSSTQVSAPAITAVALPLVRFVHDVCTIRMPLPHLHTFCFCCNLSWPCCWFSSACVLRAGLPEQDDEDARENRQEHEKAAPRRSRAGGADRDVRSAVRGSDQRCPRAVACSIEGDSRFVPGSCTIRAVSFRLQKELGTLVSMWMATETMMLDKAEIDRLFRVLFLFITPCSLR
jgi:hypothetical protein